MNTKNAHSTAGGDNCHCLTTDACLDLLHGLLPDDQREKYLAHCAECSSCEALLRRMAAERETVQARQLLRVVPGEQLERVVPDVDPAIRSTIVPGRHVFQRPVLRWVAGLAAAAVAILMLWPAGDDGKSHELLEALPAYTTDLRFRDAVDAADDDRFSSGLAAYARQDYPGAISFLREANVSRQLEIVCNIYLGSALAMEKQYAEAVECLEPLSSQTVPDPWGSEARWTLLVSWLELGRTTQADSLLAVMAKEPRNIGERARRWLQDN